MTYSYLIAIFNYYYGTQAEDFTRSAAKKLPSTNSLFTNLYSICSSLADFSCYLELIAEHKPEDVVKLMNENNDFSGKLNPR